MDFIMILYSVMCFNVNDQGRITLLFYAHVAPSIKA